MGSILGSPIGAVESDGIFMIAEWIADETLEFGRVIWETNGSE
jgi:hypothetical protein